MTNVLLQIRYRDRTAYVQADQKICSSGWVNLVSSCYYFSTYKTTGSKARSSRQKLGGNLTAPMNNEENYAIWNVAKQKSLTHPFIGLVRYKDNKFYTVGRSSEAILYKLGLERTR